MKKIIAILLSCILGVTILGGCGDKKETARESEQQNKSGQTEGIKENHIEKLKEDFKKAGFKVGDNETLAYDMLGATSGERFRLNNQLIEVYYYNKSKLNDEGKKYLKEAEKGSINFLGVNLPVKYNKAGLVLARFDEHKDKDKILKVFNSFN